MKQSSSSLKFFAALIALVAWYALILQLKLMLGSKAAPTAELLVRFFSYFTILSNIAVATITTYIALSGFDGDRYSLTRQTVLTTVAIYIFIVGMFYNTILRFLWHPLGMARLADELLHVGVPVLYLLFWYLYVPRKKLRWGNMFPWLVVPAVYIVYVLIRGNASGFYPYPFIDVPALGMQRVLIHSVGIAIVFALVSLLLIAVSNYRVKSRSI